MLADHTREVKAVLVDFKKALEFGPCQPQFPAPKRLLGGFPHFLVHFSPTCSTYPSVYELALTIRPFLN